LKEVRSKELELIFPSGTRLIALPGWKNPRLVYEAGSVCQCWTDAGLLDAYSLQGRIRRHILRIIAPLWPPRILSSGSSIPDVDRFVKGLSLPFVRKAVIVGRNDLRQKWTVIFIDGNSRPLAFLKYGEKPFARERVTHEAKILADLPQGAGPALLKDGELGSGRAFVMEPVSGQRFPRRPFCAMARNGIFGWIDRMGMKTVKAEVHPAFMRLRQQASLHSNLLCVVESCLQAVSGTDLPEGWQHGDPAPWNFRIVISGEVVAIDWEDAVSDGCPLFDLIYYVIQSHFFLRGADVSQAFLQSMDWLAKKEFFGQPADALVRLSAFDAWSRGKRDGQADAHPLQKFRLSVVNYKP